MNALEKQHMQFLLQQNKWLSYTENSTTLNNVYNLNTSEKHKLKPEVPGSLLIPFFFNAFSFM